MKRVVEDKKAHKRSSYAIENMSKYEQYRTAVASVLLSTWNCNYIDFTYQHFNDHYDLAIPKKSLFFHCACKIKRGEILEWYW